MNNLKLHSSFGYSKRSNRILHGFTLIELLVVIAIISLLVSILLPSLNKAKDLAKSVMCMSNLRHLGVAEMMYAQNYSGIIPSFYYEPNVASFIWHDWLVNEDYLEDRQILLCPSGVPNRYDSSLAVSRYRTYGMIRDYTGISALLEPPSSISPMNYTFYRLEDIDNPAYFPLIGDTQNAAWEAQEYCFVRTYFLQDGGPVGIYLRHSEKANLLFADSHVETCDEDRLEASGITAWLRADN